MDSQRRQPLRARSNFLDDLDLQPVREVRGQVLNDIPCDVPSISPPRVKFNYVDVAFPTPEDSVAGMSSGQRSPLKSLPSKEKRKIRHNSGRDERGHTKENISIFRGGDSIQRRTDESRRQYVSKLIAKGVPVWEEVPLEERHTKYIGGTNPYGQRSATSSRGSSSVTLQSSSISSHKNRRVPTAVWEDVQLERGHSPAVFLNENASVVTMNALSNKENSESQIVHSEVQPDPKSLIKLNSEQVPYRSELYSRNRNPSFRIDSREQTSSAYSADEFSPLDQLSRHSSHSSNQNLDTPDRNHDEAKIRPVYSEDLPSTPFPVNDINPSVLHGADQSSNHLCPRPDQTDFSQGGSATIVEKEYAIEEENAEDVEMKNNDYKEGEEVLPQTSNVIMKKKFGGRITAAESIITPFSWRTGEKLARAQYGALPQVPSSKELDQCGEEKHEKESTRETRGKRDLSAASRSCTQPSKRMHRSESKGEPVTEKPTKTPPRKRHYDQEEIRKYMEEKRLVQMKNRKEEKERRELEKVKKEERLKELALKTKELAQMDKNIEAEPPAGSAEKNEEKDSPNPTDVQWGCPKDCMHDVNPGQIGTHIKEANSENSNQMEKPPSERLTLVEELPKKKRKKEKRKSRKKSRSSDENESISSIVSRTVEECERQLRSSSISLNSFSSSSSSISLSSSDSEYKMTNSQSLSSSIDTLPKQRGISLGQMAQKLSNRIVQEEENLRQHLIQERLGRLPTNMHSSEFLEPSRIEDIGNDSTDINRNRPSDVFPISQVATLSVEEIIAKMTAMLPANVTQSRGRSRTPASRIEQGDSKLSRQTSSVVNGALESNDDRKTNAQLGAAASSNTPLVQHNELPKLAPPKVQGLKLSGGRSIRLEGESLNNRRKEAKISQNHEVNVTETQNAHILKPDSSSAKLGNTSSSKNASYSDPTKHSGQHSSSGRLYKLPEVTNSAKIAMRKKIEHAATIIQSVYRGYRVRKVTSALIKTRHAEDLLIQKRIADCKTNEIPQRGVMKKCNKFFKDSYLDASNHLIQDVDESVHEEIKEGIDWRKIRSDLAATSSYKPPKEASYVFQKRDLPQWVKPYVVLSETGNVSEFIESRTKIKSVDHESVFTEDRDDGATVSGKRIKNYKEDSLNQGSVENDHQNVASVNDSEVNATLIEGPLGDLEKRQDLTMSEKETQTSFNKDKMPYDRSKNKKVKRSILKNPDRSEYIDLKTHFVGDKALLLNVESSQEELSSDHSKSQNHFYSAPADFRSSEKWSISQPLPEQKLEDTTHDETLEEGLLEDLSDNIDDNGLESDIIVDNDGNDLSQPIVKDEQTINSSSVLNSSNVSGSLTVEEEILAPHQLLGEGTHFGPASLRLRLNAELIYQDSIDKARQHLCDVQQFQLISRAQEETKNVALMQQQREMEMQKKIEEEKQQREDKKRKEEQEKRVQEEAKTQQDALLSVERMEREAKDRLAELEREVRAKAEQILLSSAQRAPAPNSQPDVIAAAAVAAVGATISQWERLRPMGDNGDRLHSQLILSQGSVSSSSRTVSQHYTTSFAGSSGSASRSRSSHSQKSSTGKSNPSIKQKTGERTFTSSEKSKNSISEELPSAVPLSSIQFSSAEEQIDSEIESAKNSVTEEVESELESAKGSVVEEVNSEIESTKNSVAEDFMIESNSDFSHQNKETLSSIQVEEYIPNSNVISTKSVSEDVRNNYHQAQESASSLTELPSSTRPSRNKHRLHNIGTLNSQPSAKEISKCSIVSEDIKGSRNTSKEISESISSLQTSHRSPSSELICETELKESLPSKTISSVPSACNTEESQPKSDSSRVSGRTRPSKDSSSYSKRSPNASSASNQNTHSNKTLKRKMEISDGYSESFEAESVTDSSHESSTAVSESRNRRDYQGDLSFIVTSGNVIATVDQMNYRTATQVGNGVVNGRSGNALGMTLNLVESLQREEEVRHQHQKALLKLQEQSLVEEAKWKLAALQSEGGPGIRKRQRALLLQLREQRAHLRRLIETQNLAAQQRQLLFLQHHRLLSTTSNISSSNGRGYSTNLRGRSPSPNSPRLTPRMMEIGMSSSSEGQDDVGLHLSLKGRGTGSSSPSDSSGRERRRSRSDERKRLSSSRLQEKRRAVDPDPLQLKLLQEERIKSRSLYDGTEKDPTKAKRKGEVINKRTREKKDKSPNRVSPLTVLAQNIATSTESSVPEESIDASPHDSQSSVQEEGGCESVSHSDIASSTSEHEGATTVSHHTSTSVPVTLISSRKSLSEEAMSERHANQSESSVAKAGVNEARTASSSIGTDKFSALKAVSSGATISRTSEKLSSIKTVSDKSSQVIGDVDLLKSDIEERSSKALESPSIQNTDSEKSDKHSSSTVASVPEDVLGSKSRSGSISSKIESDLSAGELSRSFHGRSSEAKSSSQKPSSSKGLPLPLRVPLSPRSPHQHRRYSSESDDSFTLSQTETASDASDGEGKLLVLKEQLASKRAEAEILRKEKRRLRRERLASQERALKQQINAYDAYIQQARLELEKESKELKQASSMVRPVIKKPQVAETRKSRKSEPVVTSPEKSDASDLSIVSESSKSDQSYSLKPQDLEAQPLAPFKTQDSKPPSKSLLSHSVSTDPVKLHDQEPQSFESSKSQDSEAAEKSEQSQSVSVDLNEAILCSPREHGKANEASEEESSQKKPLTHDSSVNNEESEASKDSKTSSISEEYSFEEETTSEISSNNSSPLKSLSRGSSNDTDHSPSQASSTETIVQSPKKPDLSQKDVELTTSAEAGTAQTPMETNEEEKGNVLEREGVIEDARVENVESRKEENEADRKEEKKECIEETQVELGILKKEMRSEGEKKLEIFMPTPDGKSPEGDDSTDQDKDTSIEESIGEEIADDILDDAASEHSDQDMLHCDTPFLDTPQAAEEENTPSNHSLLPADTEVSAKSEPSLGSSEGFEIRQQDVNESNEDKEGKISSLSKQRLVDDISNTILSSMLKETSELFTNILKYRENAEKQPLSATPVQSSTIVPETTSDHTVCGSSSAGDSSLSFSPREENDKSANSLPSSEADMIGDALKNEKVFKDDVKISSSDHTTSSKSKILKRVGDLIAESGLSPRSPSLGSPRPSDLQLTPKMTFDLTPDNLSPLSSAPDSPMKEPARLEVSLPSTEAPPHGEISADVASSETDKDDQAVSPTHNTNRAEDYSLDLSALNEKLLNISPRAELDLDSKLDEEDTEFSVEGIEGNWFDDDFWTSADSRKKQQQLKAEEERISAEIARLEELQRLQEQFPGLVIREVPNKPPPPYTPPPSPSPSSPASPTSPASPSMPPAYTPGTENDIISELQSSISSNSVSIPYRLSKADLRKLATEVFHVVPSGEEEVMPVIDDALECLYEVWQNEQDPTDVEPPPQFTAASSNSEDNSEEEEESSSRIFRLLLFCLTRELVAEVYQQQHMPSPPPWIRPVLPSTRMLVVMHTKTKSALFSHVREQVKVLFGWSTVTQKESLMVRWARKHRDLVDQVLVKELQAEESSWTKYDEDEASVKTQVATEIFSDLIEDTVYITTKILSRKMTFLRQENYVSTNC